MKVKTRDWNEIYTEYFITTSRGNEINCILPKGAIITGARVKGKKAIIDVDSGWLKPQYRQAVQYEMPINKRVLFECWPNGDYYFV